MHCYCVVNLTAPLIGMQYCTVLAVQEVIRWWIIILNVKEQSVTFLTLTRQRKGDPGTCSLLKRTSISWVMACSGVKVTRHLPPPRTCIGSGHRRRIKPEEKAKVIAAVWGMELIQFLAAQLFWRFWRLGWIHPFLSSHPGAIHPIPETSRCETASAERN